jgi:hypothetical protein
MTIESLGSAPASWHEMKKTIIENTARLPSEASDDQHRAEKNSQVRLVRIAFADEAISRCKAKGLAAGSSEAWEEFECAYKIADDLIYPAMTDFLFDAEKLSTMTSREITTAMSITSGTNHRDLLRLASQDKRLQIDVPSFELAVGGYLQSDYRIPVVDRIIITTLLDAEITGYLHHIMAKDVFTNISPFDDFGRGRHPLLMWVGGQGRALVFYAFCIAVAVGVRVLDVVSPNTATFLILGVVGVAILWFFITLIGLSLYIPAWRKRRPQFIDLPDKMRQIYSEIHSSGPVSVKRIRDKIQNLEEIGAAWPSALWVMLDDIEARGTIALHG